MIKLIIKIYDTNKIIPPPLTSSEISNFIPSVKNIIPEILNRKAKGAQYLGVILKVQIFHIAINSKVDAVTLIANNGIS
tara:strand:+ start:541 stop:777 length:237 start_codon:yes stop_codon:yes gene_type:complete